MWENKIKLMWENKIKMKIVFTSVLVGILLCFVCVSKDGGVFDSNTDGCGKTLQELITQNDIFKIKLVVQKEQFIIAPGACYSFYSRNNKNNQWQKVFSLQFDDPISVPDKHIRFVNDKVGYIFLGEIYAVTTDAGDSWALWNSDNFSESFPEINARSIKYVKILPDGTGVMEFYKYPEDSTVITLITSDYGKFWNFQK